MKCPTCRGEGWFNKGYDDEHICRSCLGTGEQVGKKAPPRDPVEIKVKVPGFMT